MVISGNATVDFKDGKIHTLKKGDLFYVSSEPHDSWVVGEEDYVSVIREIDFTVGDAELHIDQKYWGDLGTDSDALKALMEQIKAFWQEQNSSSGIEHSSQALVAISQLSRASGQENDSEARQAVQTLKEHLRAIKDLNKRNQTKIQLLNMFYDD